MSLLKYISTRKDVFDRSLDEFLAPSLSEVVFGKAHRMYVDPEEFVSITYPTSTIKKIVNEVINAFMAGSGKVILLPSAYGGGKTHIMILLYHIARKPSLLSKLLGEQREQEHRALEGVNIIVIDGMDKRTAPSPLPDEVLEEGDVKVRTLWGYVAYKLNAYSKVRWYDETLISPEKFTLSEVFSGKKVLVLIDELGTYYKRLSEAPPEVAERLRGYPRQVAVFLRALSEIVKDNSVVVIMSIPAEPTERGFEPEPGYKSFVEEVVNEVARVAIRAEKPIATDEDFANILKRRLFESVNPEGARLASRRLKRLHADNENIVKDVSGDTENYYPFHPLFITTLRDIVERNKDLQKTRDALRIARKVVRSLHDRQELSLIMPTDIDLRIEEIRTWIVTQKFIGFDAVVDKIISKVKEIPVEEGVNQDAYRDLAYRLALYVFLRTFIYDPHLEPRSEFPGKSEVITGVYDPARYEQYLISPTMASDLLDKLSSGDIEYRAPHLYGREGYYWVTRLLDIRERVEKEAEKVEDVKAIERILDEIKALYSKPYDAREQIKPVVFSLGPVVLLKPDLVDHDAPEYKLVIVVSPMKDLKDGTYASGSVYDIVYYRLSGRQKATRRYANTVAVLLSNKEDKWMEIIKTAKMIVACERLERAIRHEYTDERIIKILREELRDMKEGLTKTLKFKLVVHYFNLIAYPAVKERKNIVQVVQVSPTQRTLVEVAEETLRKNAGKIIERMYSEQFDVIATILEGEPRQEIKWTRKMKVSDIINAFYENPELPMIPREDIRKALLSGLKELKIGVERGGKVYFKEVEDTGKLSELKDTDVVMPLEEAAERQIDELSDVKEIVEGETVVIRYYVAIRGKEEVPVRELRSRYPDNYIKVFVESDIKLREERVRHGFDVEVNPQELELRLDGAPDQVIINVFVKRIGKFEGRVSLRPESELSKVEPSSGVPDFEATWLIPVPEEPGEYVYLLHAESGKLKKTSRVKLIVKRGLLCKPDPPERILEITVRGDVEAATIVEFLKVIGKSVLGSKIVKQCNVKVEFHEEVRPDKPKRSIRVSLEDVMIDDVERVVKALSSAFGVMGRLKCFGDVKVEVRGEGIVTDFNSLAVADTTIKQRGVHVEYCW
jgi:predicted AAA+ superfamily ATPase